MGTQTEQFKAAWYEVEKKTGFELIYGKDALCWLRDCPIPRETLADFEALLMALEPAVRRQKHPDYSVYVKRDVLGILKGLRHAPRYCCNVCERRLSLNWKSRGGRESESLVLNEYNRASRLPCRTCSKACFEKNAIANQKVIEEWDKEFARRLEAREEVKKAKRLFNAIRAYVRTKDESYLDRLPEELLTAHLQDPEGDFDATGDEHREDGEHGASNGEGGR